MTATIKLPYKGSASYNMLLAIAKNPNIEKSALRHIYGYGDYVKAIRRLSALVTVIDGKCVLDLDAKAALLASEPPVPENLVPPRQINNMASPALPVANRNWSMRVGALDYQHIASHYA